MNELMNRDGGFIRVRERDGNPMISGRELHEWLGVGTAYKDWFPRMCEYGFAEGMDFCSKMSESTGGRPAADHELTIAMGKEISMIQRTERGKQARQYFLKIEEAWNEPDMVMARALQISQKRLDEAREKVVYLEAKVTTDAPLVLFAESVQASKQSILIGDLAKLLCQNGVKIGQNRLFRLLREDGYLCKNGERYNIPTQKSMEMGLMEIKESSIVTPEGEVRLNKTPKVTGKGQVYFINRYREKSA